MVALLLMPAVLAMPGLGFALVAKAPDIFDWIAWRCER